ncbi:MAG: hypothetical protein KDK39_07620 [Leptospiraceae bacterium]|nr:hypothetical protein [Leptospiraceae bacterium]
MEINNKNLLSSAQAILKNRNQERYNARHSTAGSSAAARPREASTGINSHVLRLQSSLNAAQKDYSLQQSRSAFIQNNQADPASARFDNEPLFPEFPFGKTIEAYKQEADQRIGELARTLKGLQVEMENIMALNFETAPELQLSAESLAQARGISNLNPERVAHLTNQT